MANREKGGKWVAAVAITAGGSRGSSGSGTFYEGEGKRGKEREREASSQV
jgi:hypothetical protein